MVDFQISRRHRASTEGTALAGAPADEGPDRVPGMMAVWSLICRRYRVILLGVVTGVVLAGLYGLLSAPKFESQTQILVMGKNPLPAQGGQSPADLVPVVGEDLLATHMQILASRHVVQDALKSKGLDQLPSVLHALDDDQDPDEYVIDHLQITRGGEGQGRAAHVINLRFRHTRDEDCAAILKSLVESYDRFLENTFQGGIGEAASKIDQAKNEIEADLVDIHDEYTKFREGTSLFRKGTEILNVHLLRLEAYETQLASIRLNRMETQSRLSMIDKALGAEGRPGDFDLRKLSVVGQSHTDRLSLLLNVHQDKPSSQRYNAAQAQRAKTVGTEHDILLPLLLRDEELGSKLGPDHPKIKRVRQSIQLVNTFLTEKQGTLSQVRESSQLDPALVVRTYQDMLENDLRELTQREEKIEKLVDKEKVEARNLVKDELQDAKLTSKRNRTLQLYDAVVAHVRDLDLAKGYGEFVTKVIAPIEIGEKVSPKPVPLVILGGLLGVCLGTGLAVVVDHTDRTFCGDEDIRCTLGLPVLAHLTGAPKIGTATNGKRNSQLDPALVAYHRPASPEAEVYCGLRTFLTHGSPDEQIKVLQVTSPTPGDGKTTLAANLAISLARSGKRVLLVDADMRRPRMAELFGLHAATGLSTVLAGEAELDEIVHQTEVARLWLAPCGPRPDSPSELLTRASLDQFLQQARQHYDMVLLDSPALIAASDGMEIASRVDSVLLTIHGQNNSGELALRARDLLSSVGANVLGVVVNDPSLKGRKESGPSARNRIEFWKTGRPSAEPWSDYYADADARSAQTTE